MHRSKDNDENITDAENALQQIANLILTEDDIYLDASKVTAGHVAANTIRLLIAGSQAGGLIGVSGQNIEKLRNSSVIRRCFCSNESFGGDRLSTKVVLSQSGGSNKGGFTIVSSNTKSSIHLDGVFNIISYDLVPKLQSMLMASDFKGLFGQYQGASNHEELHNFIKATMMIQRLKKDVLSQLPVKRRHNFCVRY
ncbi:hypothetical protein K1719_040217 [Acacia pycnantha]|nr:hypothetical protein K1719_040217 [Acacia pycnantha]